MKHFISGAISLKPGSSYKVVIHPEKTKRMPRPYISNCTEVYPQNLHQRVPPKAKYSSENCMLLCYDSVNVERCGCSLPFMMEGTKYRGYFKDERSLGGGGVSNMRSVLVTMMS